MRRSALRVLTLTCALALVATACGDGDEPTATTQTATTTTTPATTQPGAEETTTSAAPVATTEAPAAGGVLRVAASQGGIPQLDPHIQTFQWERVLFPLLWDGLTELDMSNQVVPGLAERWEATPDLLEITFFLRSGVKFHNGRELTAEDIVWNLERVINPDVASQDRVFLQSIASVEAVDSLTVKVTLSEPAATLPFALAPIRIIAPESLADINTNPVGTGPFTLEEFIPDQLVRLARFDDYWHGPKPLDGIEIQTVNDVTAGLTALQTGGIDFLFQVPPADALALRDNPDLNLVLADVSSLAPFWELDVTSPPFDNVVARRALAYSVDRDAIAEVAYFGSGTASQTNSLLGDSHWAFNPNLTSYAQDLPKAKELFAEAGITEGDTLIWWGIAGAFPEWTTVGEILQADLATIGITLDIQNNEVGTWVEPFYPAGKTYPNYVVPNVLSPPANPNFILGFLETGVCECNYSNARFDELAAAARATLDQEEQKQFFYEMQEIINQDVPIIVPLQAPLVSAARSNVTGAWAGSTGTPRLEDASFTE